MKVKLVQIIVLIFLTFLFFINLYASDYPTTPIRIDACIDHEAKITIEKRVVDENGLMKVEKPFLIWESQPGGCTAYKPGTHPTCGEYRTSNADITNTRITIPDCPPIILPLDDKYWSKEQTLFDSIADFFTDCYYYKGVFNLAEFCPNISTENFSDEGYIFDWEWHIHPGVSSNEQTALNDIGLANYEPTCKNSFSIKDYSEGAHYYGLTVIYEAR